MNLRSWFHPDRRWAPFLLVGLAALAVALLGYDAYRHQEAGLERAAHAQLAYIAGADVDRIEAWLAERIGDAQVTAADPLLLARLRARRPGSGPERDLDERMRALVSGYGYAAAHLLGPHREVLGSSGPVLLPWETAGAIQADAWTAPRVLWDAHPRPGQGPQMDLACLMPVRDGMGGPLLATLVLRLDPWAMLGRTLAAYPSSSPSGQTQLLAAQDGQALFLNPSLPDPSRPPTLPLTRSDSVGVQALLTGDGLKWGVDYRGVASVAVARSLKTLPWVLVAKVDRDEYLQPVRRLTQVYSALGLVFLTLGGISLAVWAQQARAERGLLAAESRVLGRQLELLSQYCNDIVVVMDADGRLLEANDRAVQAYQRDLEQLRRLRITDLRSPEGRAGYPAQFATVRREGAVRFRTVHRRADGSTFPVEVSSMAFELDGRGYIRSIVRDISEQHAYEAQIHELNAQLEDRVRERTAQLETAFREMEAFSHSVAHDLKGPLRGIDGFSHALLEDYGERLDATGRHYLQRIRSGTQRMGRIMDDLLDLSRLGRQELERTEVDVSALARQVVAALTEQSAGARQVAVSIQDGLRADGDPGLIQLVLDHLLGNAWKFTGRREQARIELGGGPDPGGGTTFYVRDNGTGFDMAFSSKLFEPFQRLHDPAEFQGAGIGLVIAQRILLRHGGRIWAEAEPDRGATFYFNLPV